MTAARTGSHTLSTDDLGADAMRSGGAIADVVAHRDLPAGPPGCPSSDGRALSLATVVSRAQDGDAAAFEQLVRGYQADLVRLGYRMLSDHGEAQDAVQDTFVLAWRNLPRLVDPQTFHAWIYQIMSRRCLNVARGRTRRRTDLAHGSRSGAGDHQSDRTVMDQPDPGEGPADRVQARAARTDLNAVLDTLPADQRACWVLKEMHDLTYPEIAYATGVPVSTVRGRIVRARQQLTRGMTAWQTPPTTP